MSQPFFLSLIRTPSSYLASAHAFLLSYRADNSRSPPRLLITSLMYFVPLKSVAMQPPVGCVSLRLTLHQRKAVTLHRPAQPWLTSPWRWTAHWR